MERGEKISRLAGPRLRGHWLRVGASVGALAALCLGVSACDSITVLRANRSCDAQGLCPEGPPGWACHPVHNICALALTVGCSGDGSTCPSSIAIGDVCPFEGSFIPCLDGGTGCDDGCRTCTPELTWGACEGAGTCTPTGAEVCNGDDDDCDGTTDNVADVDTDCSGQLGNPPNVDQWACTGGVCAIATCAPGWSQSGADPALGCDFMGCTPTPDPTEWCDGVDNDCDGTTDNVADVDTDCSGQLGNPPNVDRWACSAGTCAIAACTAGWSRSSTDPANGCDQLGGCTPTVDPAERCDGVDNDCDGSTDPPGAAGCTLHYRDQDGDAHGLASDTLCLCAPTGSYPVTLGDDCNDADPDNWAGCATCLDDDADSYFVGCDAYATRNGPDCSDADPDNWIRCASCVDTDTDGYYIGCDVYLNRNGPDCSDTDRDNWIRCATCVDLDADTYFASCDAYTTRNGPDCSDADADNWTSCATCLDIDTDTYFVGCDGYTTRNGPDCADLDPDNWNQCASCVDNDGDGYFVGCDVYLTRNGPDCSDFDVDNWLGCATCVDTDFDTYFVGCDAYTTRNGPDCNDGDNVCRTLCGPIVFNAASSAFDNGAPTLTWTHANSGTSRVLIVGVSLRFDAGQTVTAVTYDGVALNFVGAVSNTAGPGQTRLETWQGVGLATGANSVVVTLSASTAIAAGAISLTGVSQTTPIDANAFDFGTSSTPTVTVTTLTDGAWVVGGLSHEKGSQGVGAGQTQRWSTGVDILGSGSTRGPVTPPGATSMDWATQGNDRWSIGAVALTPVCQ